MFLNYGTLGNISIHLKLKYCLLYNIYYILAAAYICYTYIIVLWCFELA